MDIQKTRNQCAEQLLAAKETLAQRKAFVGLDGFVDEIVHVVDQRDDAQNYTRLKTLTALSERIQGAAGRSTNIELVNQRTKLGGNGPIMANALARLGIEVTYIGALGYPNRHPVFDHFSQRADVHSICEPGYTNALEFRDGKLMLTRSAHFSEINWANIQERYGRDLFLDHFGTDDLVGFVNWTMIPYMSEVWKALLREGCPRFSGPRRRLFFDLADPAKRTMEDLSEALELIAKFEDHFDVILGLNEKEAIAVGDVLGVSADDTSSDALAQLGLQIHKRVPTHHLVIHPVAYALSISQGNVSRVDGPVCKRPLITTGAGDHFNSGYCVGKLAGLDDTMSLLCGVSSSGFYVRNGRGPSLEDLAGMLREWPESS